MCTVNIFKCKYISIWTLTMRRSTACLRLLHSSLCCICLKISACNSHYFDPACALLDIERNNNTIVRTAGLEPLSSGSAFSWRRSFKGEQWSRCTEAALNGSKGGLCCQRNYSYRPHLSPSHCLQNRLRA